MRNSSMKVPTEIKPAVSVIIPTYNREGTLLRAVNSVLSQSFTDLELIVVDDGSTDHTRELVESIKDNRLRYIYQKNAGACAARNKGIDAAEGEFIAFQDSDDVWFKEKLARQLETMRQTGGDILFCQISRIGYGKCAEVIPELKQSAFIAYSDLMVGISTQTLLMKRRVAETIRFDETMPRFQDLEWLLRAAKKYTLYGMKEVLVKCHFSEDSISRSDERLLGGISKIHKKYPRLLKEAPAVHAVLRNFVMDEGMTRLVDNRDDYTDFLLLGFALSDKPLDRLKYLAVCFGIFRSIYVVRHQGERRRI